MTPPLITSTGAKGVAIGMISVTPVTARAAAAAAAAGVLGPRAGVGVGVRAAGAGAARAAGAGAPGEEAAAAAAVDILTALPATIEARGVPHAPQPRRPDTSCFAPVLRDKRQIKTPANATETTYAYIETVSYII